MRGNAETYCIPPLCPLFLFFVIGIATGGIFFNIPSKHCFITKAIYSAADRLGFYNILNMIVFRWFLVLAICLVFSVLLFVTIRILNERFNTNLPTDGITGFLPEFFSFLFGCCLISFAMHPPIPGNHISHYTDNNRLWIQGRVCSFPITSGAVEKFIISVDTIGIRKKSLYNGYGDCLLIGKPLKKNKNYGKYYNPYSLKKIPEEIFFHHVTGKIRISVKYGHFYICKKYKSAAKQVKAGNNCGVKTCDKKIVNTYKIGSSANDHGTDLTIHKLFPKNKNFNLYNSCFKSNLFELHIKANRSKKIKYGDTIRFAAKIKSIHNFSNPGGFNYLRYMTLKSVFGSAWVKRDKINIIKPKAKLNFVLSFLRYVENCRDNFSDFIFKSLEDKSIAAVLTALVTGKKELISRKLKQEFSRAGVSHILAISGLHLSILAGIFFCLFSWLLSFCRYLLIRGWSGRCAAFLTLFPLMAYAVFSGFSPSTRRAVIMISVFMLSFVSDREADPLNSLALAGIVILVTDPGALFSISFQLSFAAVLFIISGFSVIKKLKIGQKTGIVKTFCVFVFTSFFAIAGTQILIMHYFNIISFAGIFTNLLIIPVAGFGAVPIGLASLFIYPFSTGLSEFLVQCAGKLLYPCQFLIHHIAALPFTWARTVTPDYVEIFCYYLFFAGVFFLFGRWKKIGFFCVFSFILILSCNEFFCLRQRFFNKKMYITVLDVGQGSSALIELPRGKRILVDGGGYPDLSGFDTGKYIVAPFLWQKKIMTLDMVVLTHPESDHMNGLVYIFNNFTVKEFIKNCDQRRTYAYAELINAVSLNGSRVNIISGKNKNVKIGNAMLDFFNPFIKCKNTDEPHKDLNNNSVVFRLSFDKISVFFAGDIMKEAEMRIASEKNIIIKSNILISPHHGSSTSSSDFFLDKLAPQSVVISCGWHNRFHFPHPSVIRRYRKRGIKIFRTDLQGAVTICSDGNTFRLTTCKGK